MKDIKDFLNSKETFFKVLNILETRGDMSGVGNNFVAGGSVANTIYYLINGGDLVINDIDVYLRVEHDKRNENLWYSSVYINEEGLEVLDDQYGRTYISETGARMRVVKHSRRGIFNDVEYFYEDGYKTEITKVKLKEIVILEGFDLNCCKVGLDMVNDKIIYTPDFIEFLETKQLRVVNPCSPIQTTIRIYKKLQDLKGIFCDLKHEMCFLTVANKHVSGSQITRIVGPETKVKYDKFKKFVENYFVLRELKNIDEIPRELKEKYPTLEKCKNNIWVFDTLLDFDIIENVSSMNKLKTVWKLLYTYKKKSEQDKINKIFYKNVFLGNMKEDTWVSRKYGNNYDIFDQLTGHGTPNGYIEFPYYDSNRFTYMMILSKNNYHKCNFNIKHVDFIDKLVSDHPGLSFVLRYCDTITEQYLISKFIRSLANKEGDWIIGLLENVNWSNYKDYTDNSSSKLTKEFILKILEDEKVIKNTFLVEKVDLSGFEYKKCVKELVTTIDLMIEGGNMGHCIGGYSSSIKSGRSRIFHIDCNGIGSSVEILVPDTKRWSNKLRKSLTVKDVFTKGEKLSSCIVSYEDDSWENVNVKDIVYRRSQHFGRYPEKGNLEPTENNKAVVKALLEYLNKKRLPQNFKIKWDDNFADKEEELIFV